MTQTDLKPQTAPEPPRDPKSPPPITKVPCGCGPVDAVKKKGPKKRVLNNTKHDRE